jgi:hypothetical protein
MPMKENKTPRNLPRGLRQVVDDQILARLHQAGVIVTEDDEGDLCLVVGQPTSPTRYGRRQLCVPIRPTTTHLEYRPI